MATAAVIAVGASAAYSAYQGNKAAQTSASATKKASQTMAQSQIYASDITKQMFDTVRNTYQPYLAAGRQALSADPVTMSDATRNFQYSDPTKAGMAPGNVANFQFSQQDKINTAFNFSGQEGIEDFSFAFDPDDELYQWKEQRQAEMLEQYRAATGNMNSSFAVGEQLNAQMALMDQEVNRQYGQQYQTWSGNLEKDLQQNAQRLQTEQSQFGVTQFGANTQLNQNAQRLQTEQSQLQAGQWAHQTDVNSILANNAQQFSQEQAQYNVGLNTYNADYQAQQAQIATGLSAASGLSAAAGGTGGSLANIAMQGGAQQSQLQMYGGAQQAAAQQGQGALGMQAVNTGIQAYGLLNQ